MQKPADVQVVSYLAPLFKVSLRDLELVLSDSPTNIQVVLSRQLGTSQSANGDVIRCHVTGEAQLIQAFSSIDLGKALFTLARIYDAGHIALCKNLANARRGKPHDPSLLEWPCLDVQHLVPGLVDGLNTVEDDVVVVVSDDHTEKGILALRWEKIFPMSFDRLPVLGSLSDILPGEQSACHDYAGIGGGGGSDIISASLLGHLLRRCGKEMHMLISTRTWRTGSQGRQGSKMGVRREIYNHGGPATFNGKSVMGTYRVLGETYSEGRDLETVPINHHQDIFIVLDQGEESADIPDDEKAELSKQYQAVLGQRKEVNSVIVLDTGGDVFGSDSPAFSTPDQDIRAQRAAERLSANYPNLVTAVLAPGVDAPTNAESIAEQAGGKLYKPTREEKSLLLNLLVHEYQMDGSNPARFGKTTLALQAALRGEYGWRSLNLPSHVVDTWENPWSSFVFIRECMSDIILMPLQQLLPLIDPPIR